MSSASCGAFFRDKNLGLACNIVAAAPLLVAETYDSKHSLSYLRQAFARRCADGHLPGLPGERRLRHHHE
jgi:hypothetical protein